MKKPIYYYDETWQQGFWLLESTPVEKANKLLKKLKINTTFNGSKSGETVYNLGDEGPIIVWTIPHKDLPRRAAILAHECIHAAHICLKRCGVIADFDNDESVTYLVTVLIRKALSA